MNREIKFKCWDNLKMHYHPIITFFQYGWNVCDVAKGDAILLQYTGLKDKNGKDIYEGDVFKYVLDDGFGDVTEYTEEVIFNQGSFDLDNCPLGAFCSDGEVIGNIYENPELLK